MSDYRRLRPRKYQVLVSQVYQTHIFPDSDIVHPFFILRSDGLLIVLAGYAWDGPSGPAPDSKWAMLASLFHDALYQMMRMGLLSRRFKPHADWIYFEVLVRSGAPEHAALLHHDAVRLFGGPATQPDPHEDAVFEFVALVPA